MARKRLSTDVRHEQIAEAALAIVRAEGIRALNVAAVADKVGIVPSAVYRHFKNKSEIVGAVLQLIRSRLKAHFQEVVDLDEAPIDKLHRLLTRHIGMIAGNNAIPRLIFSEEVIGGMPDKRQALYAIIRDVIGNVAVIVREGQANGDIRRELAPESVAIAFLGMIQPAAIIWSLSAGEFDLAEHSRHAWQLFAAGIRTTDGTDRSRPL